MKRILVSFVFGVLVGAFATYFALRFAPRWVRFPGMIPPKAPPVCYACFWEGFDPKFRTKLIEFYRQYKTSDPMVSADVGYVLWRATGIGNCELREAYRNVAKNDADVHRRLQAHAVLGFSGPECGQEGSRDLRAAAKLAEQVGRPGESAIFQLLSTGKFEPRFGDIQINVSLPVPPDAKAMILGEASIEVPEGLQVGTQVERIARDWISFQMKWDLTGKPFPLSSILDYHEGRLVKNLMGLAPGQVYPLSGTLVAQKGRQWFAPDETGTFRFEVLPDKVQYSTTHASGTFGWIEDTHGISALVSQALARHVQLVVGCGDSEGKAKAAYYLAQKGVHVVFPGDRFQYVLLGYQAKGNLLGTAPVKKVSGKVVLGHQPVRFSLREPIVVEDTEHSSYPMMYYDSAARYFRRLNEFVPLNLEYVKVGAPNEISKVLERAAQVKATNVAVRVVENQEYEALRHWLAKSRQHRAILFHSGLYPYAQPLFDQFPDQVTFGDLHPRFE